MGVFMQLLCAAIVASLVYAELSKEEKAKRTQCWSDGFESCAKQHGMPDKLPDNQTVVGWVNEKIAEDKDEASGVSKFWTTLETCSKKEWPEYADAFKKCKKKWTVKVDEPEFDECMKQHVCTLEE